MKRYLLLLLLLAFLPHFTRADSFTLRNGTAVNGVIKRGGGGTVSLETSDGVVTYKLMDFDERTQTRLERYNASTPAPAPRPMVEATPVPVVQVQPVLEREEEPAPAATSVKVRKMPRDRAEWDQFTRELQGPRMFAFYAGAVLILIGGLWFLVRAFQQSIWWGLGCLLCNLLNLFFLIAHWNKAKEPFLMQLIGVGLSAAAIYVMT